MTEKDVIIERIKELNSCLYELRKYNATDYPNYKKMEDEMQENLYKLQQLGIVLPRSFWIDEERKLRGSKEWKRNANIKF